MATIPCLRKIDCVQSHVRMFPHLRRISWVLNQVAESGTNVNIQVTNCGGATETFFHHRSKMIPAQMDTLFAFRL